MDASSNQLSFSTLTGTYPAARLASGLSANTDTLIVTGAGHASIVLDVLFRNLDATNARNFDIIICSTGSNSTSENNRVQIAVPANSGNNGTTALASLASLAPSLFDMDLAGNRVITLESGISVYVRNKTALMKKHLSLILCCALFSACAKKTYVANSNAQLRQLELSKDSAANRISSITDKTVTITNRSIDTNITISGQAITGYLLPDGGASAQFENEYLKLFLRTDSTGKTTATAIPKAKTIKVRAHEQRTVYNDVVTKEAVNINTKSELAVNTSLTTKQVQKQTEGNHWLSFSLILLLLVAGLAIWIGKKFFSAGIFRSI